MEKVRLLIGDGSAFMRIMLKNVLERLGFEVTAIAKNGQEALDRYMATKPDIVLLDLTLEGMGGVTLTRVISKDNPSAIVILLVPEGSDDSDVIIDATRAGVKGYIRKPLSVEALEMRVRSMLKRGEAK